ncbi:hypothetical protein LINGRAHAP2_LOCUS9422 [Linum grandiflorum]
MVIVYLLVFILLLLVIGPTLLIHVLYNLLRIFQPRLIVYDR